MTDAPITGELLHSELCAAAAAAGKPVGAFVAPLFNGASWKLEQLRIARKPTPSTIARVRALIAGEPLPPHFRRDPRTIGLTRLEAEEAGIPPSERSHYEGHLLRRAIEIKAHVERRLALCDRARLTRRPGQTLADAVRELQQS